MRLKNSAEVHKEGLELVAGVGDIPAYNCMPRSRKGVETESEPPWQYSTGRKRKKNSIQVRSVIACCIGDLPCSVALRQCKIVMGMGQTQVGGGVLPHIGLKKNYF